MHVDGAGFERTLAGFQSLEGGDRNAGGIGQLFLTPAYQRSTGAQLFRGDHWTSNMRFSAHLIAKKLDIGLSCALKGSCKI